MLKAITNAVRDGGWLTKARMRLWAVTLLVGFSAALVFLFATSHGAADYRGRPLGTDFSCLYAAGNLAAAGMPDAAYDFVCENARLTALFGAGAPFYGWFYPPFFLPVAAALSALAYPTALAVWSAVGLALYLAAMVLLAKPLKGREWLLYALAFPAVFVNLIHGQNGFLTAALFAGALALIDKRPFAAGMLFGCLCYKPQFALLAFFALAAGKCWKPLAAAAVTAAGLAAAATLAYGTGIWHAFAAASRLAREFVLEQGGPGFEKIQSLFAFVRHAGGPVDFAYLVQAAVSALVLAAVLKLWRSKARAALKGAGLILGTLAFTPYVTDYDMVLAAPAILLVAADGIAQGFRPYEKSALALLWLMPVAARAVAGTIYFPLGFAAVALAFALVVRRGLRT
jgi:alpha-1,2-mannosyltransferase